MAIWLLLTLLLPIITPIPAWGYSINIKPKYDNGFRLTAPSPSLTASSMNFVGNLFSTMGAVISPSAKSAKESEKTFDKENLERKVKNFETQIADKQQVKKNFAIDIFMQVDEKSSFSNRKGVLNTV